MAQEPMVNRYFLESLAAAAAAAGLFLFGVTNPLLGPLLAFCAPVPLIWATCRHGLVNGLAAALVGSSFVLPFVTLTSALSFTVGNCLLGWMLGAQLRQQRGIVASSLLATVTVLTLSFIASVAYLQVAGLDAATFLRYHVQDLVRETQAALEQLSRQTAPNAEVNVSALLDFFKRSFPAILLVTLLFECMANSFIVLALLSGRPSSTFSLPTLSDFSLPDFLVWPLILSLIGLRAPWSPLRITCLNILLVLLFLFLVQGLSIAAFFLERWNSSRPVRMLVCIAALLQPYLLVLPLLAGLLDFKFKFRDRPPVEPPPPSD